MLGFLIPSDAKSRLESRTAEQADQDMKAGDSK